MNVPLRIAVIVSSILGCNFLQAAQPVWDTDPIVQEGYDRMELGFELMNYFTDPDSSKWLFQVSKNPSWLKVSRKFGSVSGMPTAKDIGHYRFVVEVSDDSGATWIATNVELRISPRPEVTCADGTTASSIGPTPDRRFEIYTCKKSGVSSPN